MVGQKFVELLQNHPLFEVKVLAASDRSAGKTFADAISGRNYFNLDNQELLNKQLLSIEADADRIAADVDLVFSAFAGEKSYIAETEISYASKGVAVVSNNSALRGDPLVPVILPEVNTHALELIDRQRAEYNFDSGLIITKPNCSVQCYVPIIDALRELEPTELNVTTLQSASGAGKRVEDWPELQGNVIPFIAGEEEKSEQEPKKILEDMEGLEIYATCTRVPVDFGHLATLQIKFSASVDLETVRQLLHDYNGRVDDNFHTAPDQFIRYCDNDDKPQPAIFSEGADPMSLHVGRMKQIKADSIRMVSLTHNLVRGAAGGAILSAELLESQNYLN
jgi:aspartate-semialdehyde dehydrogenase